MSVEYLKDSIRFSLKTPAHGWLPVTFQYQNFKLEFSASDVLNNPLDELISAITSLEKGNTASITFWLEPGAYLFKFEKREGAILLRILETKDLNAEIVETELLKVYQGPPNQIISPLKNALISFSALSYSDGDWPSRINKEKLSGLKQYGQ